MIPTTLSWESRRRRVFFTKLVAVVGSAFVVASIWHALFDAPTGLSAWEGTSGETDGAGMLPP